MISDSSNPSAKSAIPSFSYPLDKGKARPAACFSFGGEGELRAGHRRGGARRRAAGGGCSGDGRVAAVEKRKRAPSSVSVFRAPQQGRSE